jgi:hypothetical protein
VRAAIVTRYAALTRARAAAVVVVLLCLMGWLLVGARATARAPRGAAAARASNESDVALYQAITARVRAGEPYYDAVGAEMRARRYPLRPVFNWRQPTYAWLLAGLPSPWLASALLAGIALAVVLLARRWLAATPFRPYAQVATALMAVTMAGAFVPSFVFLQESWAGSLIALSVCAFALDRWRLGVAASLLALAFRELALLPCVVGLALAARERRGRELAAWIGGLAAYALLMTWHLAEVTRHTRPDDLARGWLALGGASFLLETCKWNSLFVALPSGAIAVLLPFVLLGLGGFREATRAALIVFGYLAAFTVVGRPFNEYWGAIYAPLLTFGFIAAPASVRDLARALRGRPAAPAPAWSGDPVPPPGRHV